MASNIISNSLLNNADNGAAQLFLDLPLRSFTLSNKFLVKMFSRSSSYLVRKRSRVRFPSWAPYLAHGPLLGDCPQSKHLVTVHRQNTFNLRTTDQLSWSLSTQPPARGLGNSQIKEQGPNFTFRNNVPGEGGLSQARGRKYTSDRNIKIFPQRHLCSQSISGLTRIKGQHDHDSYVATLGRIRHELGMAYRHCE